MSRARDRQDGFTPACRAIRLKRRAFYGDFVRWLTQHSRQTLVQRLHHQPSRPIGETTFADCSSVPDDTQAGVRNSVSPEKQKPSISKKMLGFVLS